MKKKSKQRPVVGVLFQAAMHFFSWLPLKWSHRCGVLLGELLWLIPNPLKNISSENITIAFPQMSVQQRKQLLKESLKELGKSFCELGPLWCWPREKLLPLVHDDGGVDTISEALERGRGVIVLSPHLGAWELIGWYWSLHFPITSLYRPPRVRSMADFMRKAREREGANLVPTDVSGIKALFRALKNNEVVGILPDQDPGKRGGVLVPFFSHPANTITLISKLIQKTAAPVFFTFAERLPHGAGFKIHVIEAGKGLDASDEQEAAGILNQQIEQCVQLVPVQYLWSYGRYRKVKKHLKRQQLQ
jgi:KDO2-lipid IV(A) lauroyltransferase